MSIIFDSFTLIPNNAEVNVSSFAMILESDEGYLVVDECNSICGHPSVTSNVVTVQQT